MADNTSYGSITIILYLVRQSVAISDSTIETVILERINISGLYIVDLRVFLTDTCTGHGRNLHCPVKLPLESMNVFNLYRAPLINVQVFVR